MLNTVLGITINNQKNIPLINYLYKTSRNNNAFYIVHTHKMASSCYDHSYGRNNDDTAPHAYEINSEITGQCHGWELNPWPKVASSTSWPLDDRARGHLTTIIRWTWLWQSISNMLTDQGLPPCLYVHTGDNQRVFEPHGRADHHVSKKTLWNPVDCFVSTAWYWHPMQNQQH